jgi:hypothetical protein
MLIDILWGVVSCVFITVGCSFHGNHCYSAPKVSCRYIGLIFLLVGLKFKKVVSVDLMFWVCSKHLGHNPEAVYSVYIISVSSIVMLFVIFSDFKMVIFKDIFHNISVCSTYPTLVLHLFI